MRFEQSVVIDAPSDRVWGVMIDVERWSDWTASINSVELLDDGPLALGSRARIRQPKFPAAVWEVTGFEEGRSFTWEASSVGLRTIAVHAIRPRPDGGSTVELSLEQQGPAAPLAKVLFGGMTRRYLALEAAGLRDRSERASR